MKKLNIESNQQWIEAFLINDYQPDGTPTYNIYYLKLMLWRIKVNITFFYIVISFSLLTSITFLILIQNNNINPLFNKPLQYALFTLLALIVCIKKYKTFSYTEKGYLNEQLTKLLNCNPENHYNNELKEKLIDISKYKPIEKNVINQKVTPTILTFDLSINEKIIEYTRKIALNDKEQAARIGHFYIIANHIKPKNDTAEAWLDVWNQLLCLEKPLKRKELVKNPFNDNSRRTDKSISKNINNLRILFERHNWVEALKILDNNIVK